MAGVSFVQPDDMLPAALMGGHVPDQDAAARAYAAMVQARDGRIPQVPPDLAGPWASAPQTPNEHDPFFGTDIQDPYAGGRTHEVLTPGQRAGFQDAWQTFGAPVASAVMAPGDIMKGNLTQDDPRFDDSANTLAMLLMGAGRVGAKPGAVGMAGGRLGSVASDELTSALMRGKEDASDTATADPAARGAPPAPASPGGAPSGPVPGRGELPGSPGRLAAPGGAGRPAVGLAPEEPLAGLPTKVTVPGVGKIDVGPIPSIRKIAADYVRSAGLPYDPPKTYAKVDPQNAARIAQAFSEMPHAPDDPAVRSAYGQMAKETMAQWRAIKDAGLKVDFIPHGAQDPYDASPRMAVEDIKKNNHMHVYPTDSGFGETSITPEEEARNPMLAQSGETISGKPARVNDIFRIVHDYFGHAKEGFGFRADGEENAWRSHAAMYSPEARRAMTTETRGQNSWLNYGPHGEANRTAKTPDTVFADQKIGLLPEWVSQDTYEK